MNTDDQPDNVLPFSLKAAIEKVNAPGFLDEAMADEYRDLALGNAIGPKAKAMDVLRVKKGLLMVRYVNASDFSTTDIFVRDAGVIARFLPGEGGTKFRIDQIMPATPAFLTYYVDGREWKGVSREYYCPAHWELDAWGWKGRARESVDAGALVLRKIGNVTCRGCGKPHRFDDPSIRKSGRCLPCAEAKVLGEHKEEVGQMADAVAAAGRNDLCPCGSGLKAKKCCK